MNELFGVIFETIELLTFGFVLTLISACTLIVFCWLGLIVVRWVYRKTLKKALESEE